MLVTLTRLEALPNAKSARHWFSRMSYIFNIQLAGNEMMMMLTDLFQGLVLSYLLKSTWIRAVRDCKHRSHLQSLQWVLRQSRRLLRVKLYTTTSHLNFFLFRYSLILDIIRKMSRMCLSRDTGWRFEATMLDNTGQFLFVNLSFAGRVLQSFRRARTTSDTKARSYQSCSLYIDIQSTNHRRIWLEALISLRAVNILGKSYLISHLFETLQPQTSLRTSSPLTHE